MPVRPSSVVPANCVTRLFPQLWVLVVGMMVLGGLARLFMWWDYAGSERSLALLWPAMLQGMRYDLVAGAVSAGLVGLLTLPVWLAGRRETAVRLAQHLLLALLLAFALLSLCEHFYYAFYKARFDPIVFGMFEDDTGAILGTV